MQSKTKWNTLKNKFFQNIVKKVGSVSPSDDDLLDLAECINEVGPGPTSNIRRVQGLPTLVMREEHGQRVPCDPS